MKPCPARLVDAVTAAVLVLALAACGGDSVTPAQTPAGMSDASPITALPPVAGVTPFIALVTLQGDALNDASTVRFVIAAEPGSVSKPVSVTYTADYLQRHGHLASHPASLAVPVFGLYAGRDNAVTILVKRADESVTSLPLTITTAAWTDPNAVYDRPTVVQARSADAALGFDFLYLKSAYGSPVIIDTDAQVRWVGPAVTAAYSSVYDDGGFVLGSNSSADIYRLDFDGSYAMTGSLARTGASNFHHDMDAGKTGYLAEVDATIGGILELESTAQEVTPDGQVIATWDLAKAVSDAMIAGGDDPTLFVRPGTDWFHMNSAIYDPSDDSVIVSSRENFVAKVDYTSGALKWILGDPTKYWYSFPSLRAKALAWVGDALVPIGQHALTLANDGSLMLFNNGYASLNQPAGAPPGQSRAYSTVSDYVIDPVARTVREAWHFDRGQGVLSTICSSVRQTADGSILVDYAAAEGDTAVHLVGLDPARTPRFDFRYANTGCDSAWNAQPIGLDALVID